MNPDEMETQILDAGPGTELPDLPAPKGLWHVCALIARSPPVLDYRMQLPHLCRRKASLLHALSLLCQILCLRLAHT